MIWTVRGDWGSQKTGAWREYRFEFVYKACQLFNDVRYSWFVHRILLTFRPTCRLHMLPVSWKVQLQWRCGAKWFFYSHGSPASQTDTIFSRFTAVVHEVMNERNCIAFTLYTLLKSYLLVLLASLRFAKSPRVWPDVSFDLWAAGVVLQSSDYRASCRAAWTKH